MNKKIVIAILLGSILLFSCKGLQYKTQTQKSLPELGSLGVFEKYIAQEITIEKSVIGVNSPLKLKVEIVTEFKREIFTNKDSINSSKEYVTLEVLDTFSLLEQINQNKELFGYLKSNPKVRIVTKVAIDFT